MTKTKISVALAAALIATPSLAADLARKAPPPIAAPWSWVGWYAGVNIGYGFGDFLITDNSSAPIVANTPIFANGVATSANGIVGGGQVGYNWVTAPNWLVGLEADFQGSGQKHTFMNKNLVGLVGSDIVGVNLDWFGTVRARVAYVVNNSNLWYITGGYAYGHTKLSVIDNNGLLPGLVASSSTEKTMSGWTLGGGLESRLFGNWTAKLEYLYVDLGKITGTALGTVPGLPPLESIIGSAHIRDNIVRAGLNYKI